MKLLSALAAGSALLAAAAPSYDSNNHHQLTFTDTFDAIDASAAEWLRASRGAIDAVLNKGGASAGNNVVEKGTEWVQKHVQDTEKCECCSGYHDGLRNPYAEMVFHGNRSQGRTTPCIP
jgi:hypothetical protein